MCGPAAPVLWQVMVRVAAWQALADLLQLADVVPATMRREVLALFLQQCQVGGAMAGRRKGVCIRLALAGQPRAAYDEL